MESSVICLVAFPPSNSTNLKISALAPLIRLEFLNLLRSPNGSI